MRPHLHGLSDTYVCRHENNGCRRSATAGRPSSWSAPTIVARSENLDRLSEHFEMEPLALVGVACRHRLLELDAEARLARGDDVAVLPGDRLLQDLGVEAAPVADALQDEEVRRAGA